MTLALALEHVSVSFDGVPVARDVTLSFERGVTTAIVGRSGAGKSVLMRAVAGLLPHSGVVRVFDPPLVFVHQDPALLDDLDVEENIAFPVSHLGLDDDEVGARVKGVIRLLDLEDVRGTALARVPLATQKRVALARALALRPGVLVADEPTTGVDPVAAARVDAALASLTATDLTLIVITHSPRTLAALAPRVVRIEDGRASQEART